MARSHTRLLSVAVAIALLTIGVAGCNEIVADGRLAACGADLPGNRVHSSLEMSTRELRNRYGIDPAAHPELAVDRPVFVVVFAGPAVLREQHGENVINRMYHQAICVWYGDAEVRVYDHVSNLDPNPHGPVP